MQQLILGKIKEAKEHRNMLLLLNYLVASTIYLVLSSLVLSLQYTKQKWLIYWNFIKIEQG